MPSRRRTILALVPLALALALAGCGSGDDQPEVPAGAIAVVGDKEIKKADYDRLIQQAERGFKAQKQEFPAAGTPEYENLKGSIVRSLVERAQWEQEAEEMGVAVKDEEVEKRLDELKQQYFQGNEKKYEEELKKQGLTDQIVRQEIRARLLSEKIYESITKDVKVSDEEIKSYYEKNKAQFEQPESREVRHILVKSKARAQQLRRQIRAGGDFARLAKRFSQDKVSAAEGGKYTAVKGRSVAPFDKFVFSAETGELSAPVKTEFGWHVIEVVSAVKPKTTTPLAEVEDSIRQTLLQQKQNQAMRRWVRELEQKYEGEIAYAPGYAPPKPTDTGEGATETETTE